MAKKNQINHKKIDEAARMFNSLSDNDKRAFFRKVGVVPIFHTGNGQGRDVYPSNATILGKVIRPMSMLMSQLEITHQNIADRRVDVGNPELGKVLSEATYYRLPDENNDIDESKNPGIFEQIILTCVEQRKAIANATNEAWIGPRYSTRRSKKNGKQSKNNPTPAQAKKTAPAIKAQSAPKSSEAKAEAKSDPPAKKAAEPKTPAKKAVAAKPATKASATEAAKPTPKAVPAAKAATSSSATAAAPSTSAKAAPAKKAVVTATASAE